MVPANCFLLHSRFYTEFPRACTSGSGHQRAHQENLWLPARDSFTCSRPLRTADVFWRRSTSADALIKQCHRIFVSLIQLYKKTYYGCVASWPELSIDLAVDYMSHARERAKETWVIGQCSVLLILRNTGSLLIWCLHCLPWVWPCFSTNYTLSDGAVASGGHSLA